MNTENAYRDLGEAVVREYIRKKCGAEEVDITVRAAQRGADWPHIFFYIGDSPHAIAVWTTEEFRAVSTVAEFRKCGFRIKKQSGRREVKENDR